MSETTHKRLAEALAAFQAEAPTIYKSAQANAGTFSYKYVDLADIVDEIRPILGKHGLSFSCFPCIADGKPALRYVLRHASGEVESDVMSLMISKADAQGHGSAITYARRYAMCAVLNIAADKDDDGAAAKAAAEKEREERTNGQTANGVTVQPHATPEDVKMLTDAAKGLTAAQIKLAFGAAGLTAPEPFVPQTAFLVPRAKTAGLYKQLGEIKRVAAAKA